MSAAGEISAMPVAAGPGLRTRIAAIVVVLALAGLAAYAVFGGPTTVSIQGPVKVAPSRTAPSEGQAEPEGEGRGGERGD